MFSSKLSSLRRGNPWGKVLSSLFEPSLNLLPADHSLLFTFVWPSAAMFVSRTRGRDKREEYWEPACVCVFLFVVYMGVATLWTTLMRLLLSVCLVLEVWPQLTPSSNKQTNRKLNNMQYRKKIIVSQVVASWPSFLFRIYLPEEDLPIVMEPITDLAVKELFTQNTFATTLVKKVCSWQVINKNTLSLISPTFR